MSKKCVRNVVEKKECVTVRASLYIFVCVLLCEYIFLDIHVYICIFVSKKCVEVSEQKSDV